MVGAAYAWESIRECVPMHQLLPSCLDGRDDERATVQVGDY